MWLLVQLCTAKTTQKTITACLRKYKNTLGIQNKNIVSSKPSEQMFHLCCSCFSANVAGRITAKHAFSALVCLKNMVPGDFCKYKLVWPCSFWRLFPSGSFPNKPKQFFFFFLIPKTESVTKVEHTSILTQKHTHSSVFASYVGHLVFIQLIPQQQLSTLRKTNTGRATSSRLSHNRNER